MHQYINFRERMEEGDSYKRTRHLRLIAWLDIQGHGGLVRQLSLNFEDMLLQVLGAPIDNETSVERGLVRSNSCGLVEQSQRQREVMARVDLQLNGPPFCST